MLLLISRLRLRWREAKQLKKVVEKTGLVLAVTHAYTGYPMVKEARQLVSGKSERSEKYTWSIHRVGYHNRKKNKQQTEAWRVDPKRAGLGGATGDIGTHHENLAEYITSSNIVELCSSLNSVVKIEDCSMTMRRFFWNLIMMPPEFFVATQVASGQENNLSIKVYGDKGGLEWRQEEPNTLIVRSLDKPKEVYRAGMGYFEWCGKEGRACSIRSPWRIPRSICKCLYLIANAVRDWQAWKKKCNRYDFPGCWRWCARNGFRGNNGEVIEVKPKWVKIPI